MVCAGLLPDARSLAETCREEATSFRRQFGRPIPISQLCYKVSQMLHAYTRHDAVRYDIDILKSVYRMFQAIWLLTYFLLVAGGKARALDT